MPASEAVFTFNDALDYCTHVLEGGSRGKAASWIREAVLGAYNEVVLANRWTYYQKEHRINLQAVQSTGTVTYDLTGHAEGEKALTIDGVLGTWPSWVKRARIQISGTIYKVKDTTTDANVILLEDNFAPLADITTGTAYQLYQSEYPFPDDLWDLQNVMVEKDNWITYYIRPTEWTQRERFFGSTGQPWAWTILKDDDLDSRWSLYIDPIPTTAEPIGFIYRRRPRTLRWGGTESAARVTLTGINAAAASSVTLTTTLPQNMVGSYIRFHGSTTDYPTGFAGQNPFYEQHRIKSISGTTVTLDGTTLSQAYSSSEKAVVSDPVDMDDQMLEAFKAAMELRLARSAGSNRGVANAYQMYLSCMRTAMENEARVRDQFVQYSRYDYLFTHLDGDITDDV